MYNLFSVFGVELEYMIVDRNSLNVLPISDKLLIEAAGELTQDYEEGEIAWSNELVLHVIELKTNGPADSLHQLDKLFHREVLKINSILKPLGGKLMPTAMHPLMNPDTEMKLWYFGRKDVYEAFDRIFNCTGHGWANLQSTHLNLPFANDDEFAKLHAAIRVVLPLIPALSASSPFKEGKYGCTDSRIVTYKGNQKRIASIAGDVIPEPIFSIDEYNEKILKKIYADITPHDPEGILQYDWLNSRGAIARFSRMAIEIRLVDIQECPLADITVMSLISETIKRLIANGSIEEQKQADQTYLINLLDECTAKGSKAFVDNKDYLRLFGLDSPVYAGEFWQKFATDMPVGSPYKNEAAELTNLGTLSERITSVCGFNPSAEQMKTVYGELTDCLEQNIFFRP